MIYFIPTATVFLIQLAIFIGWLAARKKKAVQKERLYCLAGFLAGQFYLFWETMLVKQTGTPLPNTPQQKLLMLRLLLGGVPAGFFTILGLFYLSAAGYGQLKE
jgi:hypothetical protein